MKEHKTDTHTQLDKGESFEKLTKKYAGFINKQVSKYFIEGFTKEDIRQEILQTMWKAYKTYNPERSSLFNYMFIAIRYRMATLIKYNNKKMTYLENGVYDLERMETFESEENIEKNDRKKELEKKIWNFINKQPHAKTARYYFIGKMTMKRIAEVENITTQAVGGRLKTIKKRLREEFGEELYNYFK